MHLYYKPIFLLILDLPQIRFYLQWLYIYFFIQTGMLIDVNVHPDDDLYQIKQIIISTATSDGKIS